jgi:hypothetical protein
MNTHSSNPLSCAQNLNGLSTYLSPILKERKRLIFIFAFFHVFVANVQAQDQKFEYFSESRYADYPIIGIKENFFGNYIYHADGQKIRPKEVRAYLEILPGDANEFGKSRDKLNTGRVLNYTGIAINLGAFVLLAAGGVTPDDIRPWFLASMAGMVISAIGSNLAINARRDIPNIVSNYNYLVDRDGTSGPYLKMDVRRNFFGEKIDIYDGPNLLDKARIRSMMESRPEMYADYQKALQKQNISVGLDMGKLAVDLLVLTYVISPQFQSSAPSNLLIPLIITDVGLGIASGQFRRSARNLTRKALDLYNFGDRYIPAYKQQSMEFTGPSVTLFSRSF